MATESKKKAETKASFWERVKGFFKGIRAELKKVSWPDRKRLKQNVAAVLLIVLVAAALIFVFDWLSGLILDATGFYNIKPTASSTAVESTLEEAAGTVAGEADETAADGN